jgi:hypothetical protein
MDTTFDRGYDQLNDILGKYMNNEINDSDTISDVSSIDSKFDLSLFLPNMRTSVTVGDEKLKDDSTFVIGEDSCKEEMEEEKEKHKTGIEDTNKEGDHNEHHFIMETLFSFFFCSSSSLPC